MLSFIVDRVIGIILECVSGVGEAIKRGSNFINTSVVCILLRTCLVSMLFIIKKSH